MLLIELFSRPVPNPLLEGGNVFAGKTAPISLENIDPTLTAYFEELKKLFPKKSAIFDRQHFHFLDPTEWKSQLYLIDSISTL